MKRILILTLVVPLFASANHPFDFPTNADAPTQQEMNLLVACCEHNASCCVDFSKSTNLEDFKNKVKAIDSYQSAMRDEFTLRSEEIKAKINNSQMRYQQRFDLMGNEHYRK